MTIKESLRHFVPPPRSRVIAADASFGTKEAPHLASGSVTKIVYSKIS